MYDNIIDRIIRSLNFIQSFKIKNKTVNKEVQFLFTLSSLKTYWLD